MESAQERQYKDMMLTPVGRIIPRLAWPTVLSMMTAAIYNTADTWFVSRLGDSATAATGVCLPIIAMIQAVGFWIGMGAGSNISRYLGNRKNHEANEIASSSSLLAALAGVLLTLFGILFNRGIMESLGSTPTIMPYAMEYSQIVFIGAPFSCLSFVYNNLLRSQGRSFFAMVGIVSGAVLNLALDPFFIFYLDMGISGAALSTVLCQVIGFAIMLFALLGKNSMIHLDKRYISKRIETYTLILSTGLPSLFRQGCSAVATILLNRAGGVYGDAAVAAMSVVGRVNWLIGSIVAGFGQGFQPVCGFAYGAGNYARVRKSYMFSISVCTAILITGAVSCGIFAEEIISMFKAESHMVVEIGSTALRFLCLSMPFSALVILANMLLQTTGERFLASITSISRQGMFFIPLILILPHFFGLTGVEICQAVADFCSAVLCSVVTWRFFRRLGKV
ncbi:MAG: MATE family efflux transporter [Bacteroidales bacterium]|nr:MATE family efflux transporter [Bacteroidales bacterium]